ncbi:PAS domain S-box protein [Pseudanabaena sp. FACHB-1277]|uniref:histidine kinase n=1 Tax=Pseudanabaena cinerea FACHB-1277 TaxID=2949581 RepID=A0A926URC6_9CYAN|nr:PAS domain S-box protein [Pseudanabaena cinerea]MBD2149829.1 PAS domain S-box protein [Pseudanabaena cinerea FACHB-1277]
MQNPEIPANESDRLVALERYHILDTLPEQEYDDLTQLAADICGTPISLISLVAQDRQWFKSRVGIDVMETPRDISFCGHAVADGEILNIPDTTQDVRFADNPLVLQDPNIRFYAGVPLMTPDLYALGTLCVIDRQPRTLTPKQIQQLQALSRLAVGQLELRLSGEDLVNRTANLKARVEREQLISMIANKTAALLPLPEILETSVQKLRSLLGCDRLLIWQFQSDGSGLVIAESVGADWRVALNEAISDPNFRGDIALRHKECRAITKENILTAGYPDAYLHWLQAYQVKSNLVVPMVVSGKLWGFLDGHQCINYREWQHTDLVMIDEITVQIAIAIQQAEAMAERHRCEVELRDSEERFASLASAAPVGIFRTDAEGRCIYVNERWLQVSGLTLSEALGFGWIDGIHPNDRELVFTEWNTSVAENRPFLLEYRFQNKAGQTTWGYGQAVAERNQFGETVGYVGTITDISDRKQAEASLQQLNQDLEAKVAERTQSLLQVNSLHQAILDGADYALISTDLNGVIQTFNKAAERLLGYSASELIGQFTPAIIHDPQEIVNRAANLSVELGQNILVGFEVFVAKARLGLASENEWTYIRKDGSRFPVLLSITALKDDHQEIIGFLGIAQDISDRKQAEQEILESQRFIEKIAEASPNILYLYDLQEHCNVYSNREIASVLGYTPTEIQAMGAALFANLMHPEDLAKMPDYYQQIDIAQDGEIFEIEYRMRHANGEWRWLYSRDTVFSRDDRGQIKLTIGTAQDISDRKEAERQFQNLSDRLSLAAKSSAMGIWDWDVVHNILTWDDRMYELYGITSNQFSSAYDAWSNSLHPNDRQASELAIQQALKGEKDFCQEFRVIHPDGTIRFIQAYAIVQRNERGEPLQMIGANFDISDRKQAEVTIQQTAAQLEASNRELEAFAYSVSHDLRSPLRAIDGFSNALIEDYGDRFDDEAKDYFDRIRRNIHRMGMLIDDLLRLSRVSRSEMQYSAVNLSALVQEQIDELQAINPERQVKLAIAPNIIVSADRTLMQVVINNLVQNAWKFTSHHDSAQIEFGVLQQEDRLTYFIRDDGAGFNMTFANMLFGVFQRLHNTNEFPGTGIGLATVQRAIHRHGGKVWAEGVVEQGATIYFTVPNTSIRKGV